MDSVLTIWKEKGETPLEALRRLRAERPEYADEKMAYAGRLDPMAEGLLIVLTGEACKDKEKYLKLVKTYVAKILCGVSTDTHDLLGMVTGVKSLSVKETDFMNAAGQFLGEFEQKYPAFSSKTVGGVQLHELSRRGEAVDAPSRKVTLYNLELVSTGTVSAKEVLDAAREATELVKGDFRQREISESWDHGLSSNVAARENFAVFELELSVSSGFYVRQFASDIGAKLGIPALAYSIKRTMVGEWTS